MIVKLVLECEDEILNAIPLIATDAISITDKKETFKSNCLNHTIL